MRNKDLENAWAVQWIRQEKCAKLEEENKKLKKYYDRDKEELMESCYWLARENKNLKSDLSECECSFWFENDEVWYRKREYKRLKKWIKDHCNGYWNLFPEDEMKRQWKKADKKRK
jgi:septal ring factor EnvC (AmiA/AmiB activator)